MNKVYYELSREDLRDCILITKSGDEYSVSVDALNCSPDTLIYFEGCINRDHPYGNRSFRTPEIKNVIFNDPATIVFWDDGTKTVVKCQPGDCFDPEKGLAMAIVKKAYGNKGSYCNQLKKWLPKSKKQMTFREEMAKKEPERINVIYHGGVAGCPRDKNVNKCYIMNQVNCTKCWDRVIPDELMNND